MTVDINTHTSLENALLKPDSRKAIGFASCLCFVLVLLASLCQNLSRKSIEMSLVFDAGHYLGSTQKLFNIWCKLIDLSSISSCQAMLVDLANDLLLDGPVFPLVGAVFFILINKVPTVASGAQVIILQSILQACSAVSLFLLAKKFTDSVRFGFITGMLWGLYPAAVIAAGKFLPETFSALTFILLVLILSLLVSCTKSSPHLAKLLSFTSGILSAWVMLLKPALTPVALIVDLLTFARVSNVKNKFLAVVIDGTYMVMGAAIVLIPWLFFTYSATGHMHVTPERKPAMNLKAGWDLVTDGWAASPVSYQGDNSVDKEYETADAVSSVISTWAEQPSTCLNLALRKIVRLIEIPWNDYRFKYLLIPAELQMWWHQLLCLVGLFGALMFLTSDMAKATKNNKDTENTDSTEDTEDTKNNESNKRARNFIGLSCIAVIIGHLIYVLFVSNARYGFTVMPFIVLMAGYILSKVPIILGQNKALLFLTTTIFAVLFIVFCQVDLIPFFALACKVPMFLPWLELTFRSALLLLMLWLTLRVLTALSKAANNVAFKKKQLVFILVFLGAFVVMAAFTAKRYALAEWGCKLETSMLACRKVYLPSSGFVNSGKPQWAIIIFDGDSASSEAQVYVNGRAVKQKPQPIFDFHAINKNEHELFAIFASLLRQPEHNMRQWRAVQVPLQWLNWNSENVLSIGGRLPSVPTIYGAYAVNSAKIIDIPALNIFSPTKLLNAVTSLESRTPSKILNLTSNVCWLTDKGKRELRDLSLDPGVQFGQYRIFLVLGCSEWTNKDKTINLQAAKIKIL